MRLFSLLLVTLTLTAVLAACGGLGDSTGATCPSGSTLTYANFGQAFFKTHCGDCHSNSGGVSPKFETVESIRQYSSTIDRAAAKGPKSTNTYMPEEGDVSDADRAKLGEWLACGAP